MTNDDYAIEQQALAAAWKKRTPALWSPARQPAPWINQDGKPVGTYAHCLPSEFTDANLLPGNHEDIDLFRELGIPWHCGIGEGLGRRRGKGGGTRSGRSKLLRAIGRWRAPVVVPRWSFDLRNSVEMPSTDAGRG